MGLETRTRGQYITILSGKFCQRVNENTPGAIERINKVGKTVHEMFYDSFTGYIVNIRVTESDQYGKSWVFDLQDDSNSAFHLQLSYSDKFAKGILKMLPNIDLTKSIRMSPSIKLVEGKNQSTLFMNQNELPIKHAYTKANPNGLPQMVQKTVKGNIVWDDTEQCDFLFEMVKNDILPKFSIATEIPLEKSNVEENDIISEEDIPF